MVINQIDFPIYPIIIILSIVLGMIYIYSGLKEEKCCDKNCLLYFVMYICFSIIFGKIFTIITNPQERAFLDIGLSSYGGLVGVIVSSIVFEKIIPMNGKIIRYSIISLPLVYSISKIACFIVGCCYGIPYNGFLSVSYPQKVSVPLFPIQAVETIAFFIIFVICNHKKNHRNIIYYTICLSSITKFLLDFLRYDHLRKMITVNQIFSIILLIGTIIICHLKKEE